MPSDFPDAAYQVAELHAWVATHANGGEGIVSADMPIAPGMWRHVPLISSQRHLAERLKDLAFRAAKLAEDSGAGPVTLKLVTFRRVPDDP